MLTTHKVAVGLTSKAELQLETSKEYESAVKAAAFPFALI